MHGDRILRINELLRGELSSLLLSDMKDNRLKNVVVTSVSTSRDLANATVYYSTYSKAGSEVQRALENSSSFIQKSIGKNLNLRKVPKIKFVYDPTSKNATQIDALIHAAMQRTSSSQ